MDHTARRIVKKTGAIGYRVLDEFGCAAGSQIDSFEQVGPAPRQHPDADGEGDGIDRQQAESQPKTDLRIGWLPRAIG